VRIGTGLAALYALNDLGAVLGSMLAGFVLLPTSALCNATYAAAFLNVFVAAIACALPLLHRGRPARSQEALSAALNLNGSPLSSSSRWIVATLFALSGFAALTFQMAWVRLFAWS